MIQQTGLNFSMECSHNRHTHILFLAHTHTHTHARARACARARTNARALRHQAHLRAELVPAAFAVESPNVPSTHSLQLGGIVFTLQLHIPVTTSHAMEPPTVPAGTQPQSVETTVAKTTTAMTTFALQCNKLARNHIHHKQNFEKHTE